MTILSPKGKRWCLFAAVACVISASVFGALYARVRNVGARLPALLLQIEENEKRLGTAAMLQKLASETELTRTALAKVVIQKDGAAGFIEAFETAGRRIGVVVAIDSVEPRERATPNLEELRMTLHATGSWEKVARFAALVETLPIESRVLSAAFSRTGVLGESFWRADITLAALKEK